MAHGSWRPCSTLQPALKNFWIAFCDLVPVLPLSPHRKNCVIVAGFCEAGFKSLATLPRALAPSDILGRRDAG